VLPAMGTTELASKFHRSRFLVGVLVVLGLVVVGTEVSLPLANALGLDRDEVASIVRSMAGGNSELTCISFVEFACTGGVSQTAPPPEIPTCHLPLAGFISG
jgi:hypothetical protein